MSLIDNELDLISQIVKHYKSVRKKEFERATSKIQKVLSSLINKTATNGIASSNGNKKIKYYTFTSRVKDPESLKEKFIRNNLLTSFDDIINGEVLNKESVINKIKEELDDLIGIRILTDLDKDCKRIYEIISSTSFKDKCREKEIEFIQSDQPQKMRNGFSIYKMKGIYKEYKFELQIKSRIIAAWGDLEHSLFYKDYDITPVKETAQNAMLHVGKLLEDIDDFLLSIREANSHYKEKAEVLLFIDKFEKNYSSVLKKELRGIPFKLDTISEVLYNVSKRLQLDISVSSKFNKEHFIIEPTINYLRNYAKLRNSSYNLKILEGIVLGWYKTSQNDQKEIDATNIDEYLQNLINLLIDSNFIYIEKKVESISSDPVYYKENFKKLFEEGLEKKCNEMLITNPEKIAFYFGDIYNKMLDVSYDYFEADDINFEKLKLSVFVGLFEGEFDSYELDAESHPEIIRYLNALKENYKKDKILQNIFDKIAK